MQVKVDEKKCMRCGGCVITCPFGCLFLKEKLLVENCRECGICVKSCPVGALVWKK